MAQPPSDPPAHGPGDDRPAVPPAHGPGDGWPADRPAPGYGDGWPDDDWADDQWPDGSWPGDYPAGWPAVPRPVADPDLLTWLHSNALAVAVVAVLAGAAGAFLAFLLIQGPPASPAAAQVPRSALPSAPGQGTGGVNPAGALPGAANGQLQILVVGKVTAVSSTSITVAGQGNAITGAVTAATKVTGRVTGISGVKAGDQVLVKFTGTPGTFTAATIQDPASIS
jgi:hypothetical protein